MRPPPALPQEVGQQSDDDDNEPDPEHGVADRSGEFVVSHRALGFLHRDALASGEEATSAKAVPVVDTRST